MKRFLIFSSTCWVDVALWAQDTQSLDLTSVRIQSEAARTILKAGQIRVRNQRTTYMPKGALSVLKTEAPSRKACEETLTRLVTIHGQKPTRVKMLGGLMSMPSKDAAVWVHPASGGCKYTSTKDSMTQPARFKDFKEAVQKGLDFIAQHGLVTLMDGEELDIASVSVVNNVLSNVEKPEDPLEQFQSDYYVSFGRRFRDVPLVGSHITLRFAGEGRVAMISKNWRPITAVEASVPLREEKIEDLIFQSPEFREAYANRNLSPKDIHIAYVRAGYIEAPFDYAQERIRPGVLVSFWVGEARSEMDGELLLPLEKDRDSAALLGQRKQ